MNKEVKDFAVQKTKELMEAGSCSREAKASMRLRRRKNTSRSWKVILCRSTC